MHYVLMFHVEDFDQDKFDKFKSVVCKDPSESYCPTEKVFDYEKHSDNEYKFTIHLPDVEYRTALSILKSYLCGISSVLGGTIIDLGFYRLFLPTTLDVKWIKSNAHHD